MNERLGDVRGGGGLPLTLAGDPRLPGFNDGTILPPSTFRPGTPARDVRRAAIDRAPLRGDVRVIVVLADFTDKAFEVDTSRGLIDCSASPVFTVRHQVAVGREHQVGALVTEAFRDGHHRLLD